MMKVWDPEYPISIAWLNDFLFCPASIFMHQLYEEMDERTYKEVVQFRGKHAHKNVDKPFLNGKLLTSFFVYSEKYGLYGKIDRYDTATRELCEFKNKVHKVFKGFIYQLFAQCLCLEEMGYEVNSVSLYSVSDNKKYFFNTPSNDEEAMKDFLTHLERIKTFNFSTFKQTNPEKCLNCIYSTPCYWKL